MHPEKSGSEARAKNRSTVERRSDRELVVTRTFDGPAKMVFDAWTKPELLKRWWAPSSRGVKLISCDVDLRVGGKYRYVFGHDRMEPVAFSGTYSVVERPTRLVATQLFEPIPQAGDAIVTTTFDEKAGKTTLILHQLHPSKESLDGAVASGMEDGMRETFDQLEDLVATMKAS